MSYPISWREMVRAATNWAEEKYNATRVFRKSGFEPTATGDFPPTPILSLTQDPNAGCQDSTLFSLVDAFDGPGDEADEAALVDYLETELSGSIEDLMQPEWDEVLADGVARSKTFDVNGCLVSLTIDREFVEAGGCQNLGYTWDGLGGTTEDVITQGPDATEVADYGDLRPGEVFTIFQLVGLGTYVFSADYQVISYPECRVHFGTPQMEPIPSDDDLRDLATPESLRRWTGSGSSGVRPYMIKIPLWLEYLSPLVVLWHHSLDTSGTRDPDDYYVVSLPAPMLWVGLSAKSRTADLEAPIDVGTPTENNGFLFTDGEISSSRGDPPFSFSPWRMQDIHKDPTDEMMPYDFVVVGGGAGSALGDEPSHLDGGPVGLRGRGDGVAAATAALAAQISDYEAQRPFWAPPLSYNEETECFEVHYDTHDIAPYINIDSCFPAGQYRAIVWMAQNWLAGQDGEDFTSDGDSYFGLPTGGHIKPMNEFFEAPDITDFTPDAYGRTIHGLYDGKTWAKDGASEWQEKLVVEEDTYSVILTDAEMLGGA